MLLCMSNHVESLIRYLLEHPLEPQGSSSMYETTLRLIPPYLTLIQHSYELLVNEIGTLRI